MAMTGLGEKECPSCGRDTYGQKSDDQFTVDGWYGDAYIAWGLCGGVRVARITAKRCRDPRCGFLKRVENAFD